VSKLTEERQKLADALDAANQRHREALRCARQEGRADAAQEVTADLLVFSKDLEAKRVTGTLTELAEKHRELTCEFLRAVEERGLVVTPAGTERGWGVAITDPAIDLEIESTLAEASEARAALAAFDAEHGETLAAEQKAAEAQKIRDALDGDDPDAIRELINGARDTALTTADLV